MDAGMVGLRVASAVVGPVVKRLLAPPGAEGAEFTGKPVRIRRLLAFTGDHRTLDEADLHRLADELVQRALRGGQETAVPHEERNAVVHALARTLHALAGLDMDDVQAVELGPERLAVKLAQHAGADATDHLSADAAVFHDRLLQTACLHVLYFFSQRPGFAARTQIEHSRRLADLIEKVDLLIERIPSELSRDAAFEARYAEYIVRRHQEVTIFGVDVRNGSRSWPLDTAYLSLEAVRPTYQAMGWDTESADVAAASRPVEEALSGHHRVLLRGAAGSGKTTLVQWLAVTTARQHNLPTPLAHLLGRVPFVLPLRTLTRSDAELPIPADFLHRVSCPLTPPDGWAERVLHAGRGLLLIDGIDEVPEPERHRTRRWLTELTAAFPGNLWLVTSRPSAVRADWLARDGFTELALTPMRPSDIALFIRRWHASVGADAEQAESLIGALRLKGGLARLATNPLMCGLICALYEERRGFLPRGRKALYEAALSMLLERRDRERNVYGQGGMELEEETATELLQHLAYWLIRNGRSEMARKDAVEQVRRLLPTMPDVAAMGDAEEVLRHLLVRSGVLREPADGVIDFLHRTFQDFLGAGAIVVERDFGLLISHAHRDQWEDVLRMAVAHARPAERAEILTQLADRADLQSESLRARLRLLSLACLEHAPKLDPAVRQRVEADAAGLLPPRAIWEASLLAEAGPLVLELLPDPAGLKDHEATATVHTACRIGGDAALPLLRAFAHSGMTATDRQLLEHWDQFDTSSYGDEVIRPIVSRPHKVPVVVRSIKELQMCGTMDTCERVALQGDLSQEEITSALSHLPLRELRILGNRKISRLEFLAVFPDLTTLALESCPNVENIASLRRLSLLESVTLQDLPRLDTLGGLGECHELSVLLLGAGVPWHGYDAPPCLRQVSRLRVPPTAHTLTHLGQFKKLTALSVQLVQAPFDASSWPLINTAPNLESLTVSYPQLADLLEAGVRLKRVKQLSVTAAGRGGRESLIGLTRCLPYLEHLTLHSPGFVNLGNLSEKRSRLREIVITNPGRFGNAVFLPDGVKLTIYPPPRETYLR
ncbi:NACHT N-terminal Helical domain 1-containing protein [Streptomyces milbemycinicus]|uniref:NACHT domain-containing protein n=1 Tax=Streptomyces milbemycinicus TaxID=476552 RepID=A0ABW8LKJ1_9ACTN